MRGCNNFNLKADAKEHNLRLYNAKVVITIIVKRLQFKFDY